MPIRTPRRAARVTANKSQSRLQCSTSQRARATTGRRAACNHRFDHWRARRNFPAVHMASSLPAAACGHVDAFAWTCSGSDCSDTACRACAEHGLDEEPDLASEGRPPTRAFEPWNACDFCQRRECGDCGVGAYAFCEEPTCTKMSCDDCFRVQFCDCVNGLCAEHSTFCANCEKTLCRNCSARGVACSICVRHAVTLLMSNDPAQLTTRPSRDPPILRTSRSVSNALTVHQDSAKRTSATSSFALLAKPRTAARAARGARSAPRTFATATTATASAPTAKPSLVRAAQSTTGARPSRARACAGATASSR